MVNEGRKIKLFTLSTCVHCKALRDFFESRKLCFEYIDVDLLQGRERQEMLKEVKRFNARGSFPTAVIGERVVVGFREDELMEALAFSKGLQCD